MKNLFLLLFLTLFFACRKNDSLPAPETVNDATTVTSSIRGVVVNENDIPVMGASVTLGSNTATTNAYGIFEFTNKSMSQNNAYIKVSKTGYFTGNRNMMVTANKTQLTRIKLLPKTTTGTINATSGGIVTLASGTKVTFPTSAIVDASGAAYTGTVNVAMAYLNPTATDLASTMVGDLRGIATTGGERVLETYGMVGVELTSTTGQTLKLATGKLAEISSPIPTALQATAPSTIQLWHFDETKGRWIEEGTATKIGNNYVGQVAHFSFWNYDIGGSPINLCVTVLTPTNAPINNATVRIRRASNPASMSYGYTDATGNVCGLVFRNEALVLEVLDRCGSVIYTQNIGPYTANASVTVTATIPATSTIILTGNVTNCSNAAVTNGSVFIATNNGYHYTAPVNASGAFSISIINCAGSLINYTALPIDNTALQQGATVGGSATNGTFNLGTLQACGTSSQQYVNTLIDGVPYVWVTPTDSLGAYSTTVPPTPYAFGTTIYGNNSAVGGTSGNAYQLGFNYNAAIGNYPINNSFISIRLAANTVMSSQQINSPTPQVNLTTVGVPVSGFLEGNYNITMLFNPGNVTRNVQCNFKVRRP